MTEQEQKKIPIQNYIWESLEAALKAESRRLIRDIAKSLGKDEGELARYIGNPTISAYFVDMNEPTSECFQCNAYDINGPIQKPCRKPVIFGTSKCTLHSYSAQKPSSNLPKFRILNYYDEDDNLKQVYLNPATNEVYEKETLRQIGAWNTQTQTLTLFIM